MSFAADIQAFIMKAERVTQDVFVNVVAATHTSITDGSAVTGAPGQPVDTGALKASWQLEYDTPTSALISTNIAYAEGIENGIGPHGPLTLRSAVGGFHSVALTRAGFANIVADEGAKVQGYANGSYGWAGETGG
jgi:hypothetical protein